MTLRSICQTCKSDRCGNHAACSRKAKRAATEQALENLFVSAMELVATKLGRPLTDAEAEGVMDEVERKLLKRAVFGIAAT